MWQKIFFNVQSIQRETDSAVLIQMPNRSDYKGWVFWHPRKLVREQGGKGWHCSFSFTDEWKFNVKLYGRGKHNGMDVISEETLTASEIKKAFGVVDENVNEFVVLETEKIIEKEIPVYEVEKHIPEKKYPVTDNTIQKLKK